ncbi:MAG: two-component system, chemotaxis family, protein-glutamate methylesterase/glutaminase [Campylobacterota bacterium]|nr:two-component system, chemotaxis family, protein-glutamate methylesterase/glutaminase [Campylobacterota bacterium]MDQ1267416.1 two-component system, chemotaxis family, protein-glutamate methylesterase/glutaminase [Campylobacterota bacterium]MDQ1338525.1 two-component system, chemotaxis family, protein-glutamate methylesterase/glutaminase [Campylobacterota bacterium]
MLNLKHSALNKIVLIGASTGGPGQIEKIIRSLPRLSDTTVIVAQHMAIDFIPSFVKRLQEQSVNPVIMAMENSAIKAGTIYFCHGMATIKREGYELNFKVESSKEYKYNPDINTIFNSFVQFANAIDILAVILTGIGDDGVKGCRELSMAGARTLTQNEESAIVDGMPSRARKEVPNIEISNIETIREKIKGFCS